MSNDYYNYSAGNLVDGRTAYASVWATIFAQIEAAFDLLPDIADLEAMVAGSGVLCSATDTAIGTLYGTDGTDGKVRVGEGLDIALGNSPGDEYITLSGEDASTTNKGIASFNSVDFSVSSGAVSKNLGGSYAKTEADSPYSVSTDDVRGNRVFTNYGATAEVIFNLPDCAIGYEIHFRVGAAYNLKVVAYSGDYIRRGPTVSGAGGYIACATTNASFTLRALATNVWHVTHMTEALDLDGTTVYCTPDASSSVKGVASFNQDDFTVSSGDVSRALMQEQDHTSDHTLDAGECRGNYIFTNTGASGTVILTLPGASPGREAWFRVVGTNELRAKAASGDYIVYDGVASIEEGYVSSDATSRVFAVKAITNAWWEVVYMSGALNLETS